MGVEKSWEGRKRGKKRTDSRVGNEPERGQLRKFTCVRLLATEWSVRVDEDLQCIELRRLI